MIKVITPVDLPANLQDGFPICTRSNFGLWLTDEMGEALPSYYCSECQRPITLPAEAMPYCANCGALMINVTSVQHLMRKRFDDYHERSHEDDFS